MRPEIKNRIESLRDFMQKNNIAAFIVPSTDPHAGEYVPAHWESRKWISGFTGSAGTVVVTQDEAGLWTDSRYFLQAAEQLDGTGISLFKDRLPGTPSIPQWLGCTLHPGDRVGIDGWVNSADETAAIQESLQPYDIELVSVPDPFDTLWTDRPALPTDPVFILEQKFAGETCADKLERIRKAIAANGCSSIILSALDEIAWALNLRGNDVHCNPVFISYLLIAPQRSTLYIIKEKISDEVRCYLAANGVDIRPYEALQDDLQRYEDTCNGALQLSPLANESLYRLAESYADARIAPSPVALLKAVKNPTEAAGFRQAMKRDGIAMVRFLRWLKAAVATGNETELSVDRKLYELRAEQPFFKGISFDTIAGYKEHAAIVHYEATPETDIPLRPEGMLLLDSGAQYLDGTTDITRTIVLGPLTEEEKTDYTLVLKGHLQLQNACFPAGTCGTQLDILARQAMWKAGINYLHGTGHGVGHFLCVHEGPHQIRMNHMPTPLVPGMTVTDEPGIYKAGRHGIRTENTLLVVPAMETEFGAFYRFEPLTLCPIDKEAIIPSLLSDEETKWLDEYHAYVYRQLAPELEEEEKAWLKEATAPLQR